MVLSIWALSFLVNGSYDAFPKNRVALLPKKLFKADVQDLPKTLLPKLNRRSIFGGCNSDVNPGRKFFNLLFKSHPDIEAHDCPVSSIWVTFTKNNVLLLEVVENVFFHVITHSWLPVTIRGKFTAHIPPFFCMFENPSCWASTNEMPAAGCTTSQFLKKP